MIGELERLYSPGIFDIVFPFFAFFFVIVLPSVFAISVIVKVLRGQYSGEDQRK
jgi:hypothetical protein